MYKEIDLPSLPLSFLPPSPPPFFFPLPPFPLTSSLNPSHPIPSHHLPTSALSCVCEPGHMPKLIIKQSRQNPTTTYTNSWWKLASRCLMPNFQSILPIVNCTKCCKQSILSARKRRGSYEFMDSGEKNREALYRKWALGRYKQARSGPRASRSKRR